MHYLTLQFDQLSPRHTITKCTMILNKNCCHYIDKIVPYYVIKYWVDLKLLLLSILCLKGRNCILLDSSCCAKMFALITCDKHFDCLQWNTEMNTLEECNSNNFSTGIVSMDHIAQLIFTHLIHMRIHIPIQFCVTQIHNRSEIREEEFINNKDTLYFTTPTYYF